MNPDPRPSSRVLPGGRVVTGNSIPEQTPVKKLFLRVSLPFAKRAASYKGNPSKPSGPAKLLTDCIVERSHVAFEKLKTIPFN